MKNRIEKYRKQMGLTQRELAIKAGTSQQQIQRIEAGNVAARLDVARKIASSLNKPLESVFPDLSAIPQRTDDSLGLLEDVAYSQFNWAGIEADLRSWSMIFLLNGHKDPLTYPMAAGEHRRIFETIQCEVDGVKFISFDTEKSRVAINLGELSFCNFLFDMAGDEMAEQEVSNEVSVYFVGSPKPYHFRVEEDEREPNDPIMPGQLGIIFAQLEGEPDEGERIIFEDEDGEYVFLRTGNIALIEAPLHLIESVIDETDSPDE